MPPNHRLLETLRSRRNAMRRNQWERLHHTSKVGETAWWHHNFLRLGWSPKKGRYVWTTKPLNSGETILVEKPLIGRDENALQDQVDRHKEYHDLDGGVRDCIRLNSFEHAAGVALYLRGSMFAHSCKPNAVFRDDKWLTNCNVSAGSEVTISYVGENLTRLPKKKRWLELHHWFPRCRCSECL